MDNKILKIDADAKTEIRPFEMTDLNGETTATFKTPTLDGKKRATITRNPKGFQSPQKDRRFQIDPTLRGLLSVDEETESEINRRVEDKLAELRLAAETEAKDRGYDEGFKRGKAEAKATFEAESREKSERLDQFLAAVESMKDEAYRVNERFLVELVFRIASSVLQREIILDHEFVARIVRTIVEKVGVKDQLKLIANPTQIELLQGLVPELEKKHTSLRNITIESSTHLDAADIVIETDWNRIDATLDTQLGSLHEVVLAALEEKHLAETVESAAPSTPSESESA